MGTVTSLSDFRKGKVSNELNRLLAKVQRLSRFPPQNHDIIQILSLRDRVEEGKEALSFREMDQLERLDRLLLVNKGYIVQCLTQCICTRKNPPRSHWWWYLHEIKL